MAGSSKTLLEGEMKMAKLLVIAGRIAAVLGVSLCAAAGLARILGIYNIGGFEAVTLLIGGIALMVMACLEKLYQADFT
jgi:hypothetical protein